MDPEDLKKKLTDGLNPHHFTGEPNSGRDCICGLPYDHKIHYVPKEEA